MNYYNIVKKIKETSLQHKLVNEVSEGDIYEHLNSGDHKYPCVFLTVTSISNSADNDIQTINGSLFYVDRMLSDKANKLHIQSNGITTLKQVFSQLQETYDDITIGDQTYTPFEEKFADVCAGVFANFSISYENEITCSDSEYEVQTITLTQNGVYDVIGYDTAIVNVDPVWGTIVGEITEQEDLVDFVTGQTPHIEAGTNISIDTSGITKTINCTYEYDDSEVRELIADNTQAIEDEVEEREQADAALQAQIEDLDDFTCGQIIPTTTNFVSGTTYSIEESLQRTANLFGGQQGEINTINSKLGDCTTSNTAADKAFVNSTVATNAANFRGNFTNWANVPTDASGYTEDYRGTKTPTNNDYMVVQDATDYATGNTGMWRFMYIGDWATIGKNGWKPQYRVGSAFTERQQAAIDSGINSTKVAQYDGYAADITALETDKLDKVYSSGRKIYGVGTNGAQKMYTAGTNIQFNENGTISATDTANYYYADDKTLSLSGNTFKIKKDLIEKGSSTLKYKNFEGNQMIKSNLNATELWSPNGENKMFNLKNDQLQIAWPGSGSSPTTGDWMLNTANDKLQLFFKGNNLPSIKLEEQKTVIYSPQSQYTFIGLGPDGFQDYSGINMNYNNNTVFKADDDATSVQYKDQAIIQGNDNKTTLKYNNTECFKAAEYITRVSAPGYEYNGLELYSDHAELRVPSSAGIRIDDGEIKFEDKNTNTVFSVDTEGNTMSAFGYEVLDSEGYIPDERLQLKTIGGQSIKGEGDISFSAGLGMNVSGTTFVNSAPIFYVEGSDSDTTGVWTGTIAGVTSYYDGLTIVYVPKKSGTSSGDKTTLNINNLGAQPIYMNAVRVTTHFSASVPVVMTYYDEAFRITDYYTSASVPVGLSTTSAAAAAKAASFSYWDDKDKTYLYVTFRYANTKKEALTLNVNSTSAYPIYIDGVISSATNYTIAAGTHIMLLYNNIYWMYSDGSIPVLDGTTVKKVTDLKYDDSSLSAQVTANTAAIATKQDTLVSGTNIKTINNQSLLGSGNIDIQGGGSYSAGTGITIANNTISAVKGDWEWKSDGTNSIALGNNASATNNNSIAIGNSAVANRDRQIIIGNKKPINISPAAASKHHPTIIIGENRTNDNNSIIFDGVLVGQDNNVWLDNGTTTTLGVVPANGVVVGNSNTVKYISKDVLDTADTQGKDNVVIGNNNTVYASGTTVCGSYNYGGYGNNSSGINCVVVGKKSRVSQSGAIAIGYNAEATQNNAIQLGTGSNNNSGTFKVLSYEVLKSDGKINDNRLQLKTINGNDIRGEGNISIEAPVSKVKKVSVHKGIPCSKLVVTEGVPEYVENFGGKQGNLYYKPKNAPWTLRKLNQEQYDYLVSKYDNDDIDILSTTINDNRYEGGTSVVYSYTVQFEFKDLGDDDYGHTNHAYIFESNVDTYYLEEFIESNAVRAEMLTDVTEASDIPCKSDFRIERGRIICIKEPDLYIGAGVEDFDYGLYESYGIGNGKNKQLCIRNAYNKIGGVDVKHFTLDSNYSATNYKLTRNYHAVVTKGHMLCNNNIDVSPKKAISTSSIERLKSGQKVKIYPNARRRYRSVKHFDFICDGDKYIRELI